MQFELTDFSYIFHTIIIIIKETINVSHIKTIQSPTKVVNCYQKSGNRKKVIIEGYKASTLSFSNAPLALKHSQLLSLFYLQEETSSSARKTFEHYILRDKKTNYDFRKEEGADPVYNFYCDCPVEQIQSIYSSVFKFERKHYRRRRSTQSITVEMANCIRSSLLSLIKPPKEALKFLLANEGVVGR